MNRKIIIYAHFAGDGNTEELRNWLVRQQVRELVYIAFPFEDSKESAVILSRYEDGRLVETRRSLIRFKSPFLFSYLKDVLYGLCWGRRYGRNADCFFGGDNLLTFCGIMLRRLFRVKKVFYYMIDYTPRRYASRLLNGLYYWLDRQAACRCTEVWVLAEETIRGRFNAGYLNPLSVRWKVVPYGTHTESISLPETVCPKRLVYMGGLLESKGAHRLLEIYQAVAARRPSDDLPEMVIIGRGPLEETVRQQAAAGLFKDKVHVLGYIEDSSEVLAELCRGGIALAPYDPGDPNNFSFFADAGKLKMYVGCGLPVVATDVPPFVREILRCGAGRVACLDSQDFAVQIDEILSRYDLYREAALRLGREYDWDSIFRKAFDL